MRLRPIALARWLMVPFGLVAACSAESPVTRGDAGPALDATRPDAGRECALDLECDDRVDCTADACRGGRCVREPAASRCPAGSACDPTRGCLPRRTCAQGRDCADDDPCTTGERCESNGRYCVFDTLPNDSPCGDQRVCRGGACVCPPSRSTRCGAACVDARTDPDNCGACGASCGAGAWCGDGRCACSTPQTWCPRGGCTDPTIDGANCGACGNACAAPATCESGRCVLPCAAGTHRCGAACAPDAATASCGARCEPCPAPPNGRATCEGAGPAAACGITCDAGYHACGSACASNNALATCGDRCTPCVTPANGSVACVMGACQVSCAAGFHACGGACAPDGAVASCGARCEPCPMPEHGVASCVAGRCDLACSAGFTRCGDLCSDGTTALACGPACTRCPVPDNGVATCAAGACGLRCNAGYHACGGACGDDRSPRSCGSRCAPCPTPPHSAGTCADGACGFECDPGYAREGDACRELPRLRWPPSGSQLTGRRPTFRWTLPAGAADASLEVCRDRACARVVATLAGDGSARPSADLPVATLFWRVRAGSLASPTWPVSVGGRPDAPDAPSAPWGDNPDFDGDGFADVAASSPLAGAPRVYVFRGTATGVTPVGRLTLDSPSEAPAPAFSSQFGWSLAAADFTGDGYTDLAVGAPAYMGETGRVYVYHGGPTGLRATPDAVLEGRDGMRANFGYGVASAGDVNGDGFGDLAIGAWNASANGRVYIHLGGGRGVGAAPATTLEGPPGMTRFGYALGGAGDVDDDGDGDLVVGATEFSGGAGRAFAFSGSPLGLGSAPLVLDDPYGGRLGSSAVGVGDLNGDGFPDVAVGAPAINNGAGRVHIFQGGRAGLATPAARSLVSPTGMESDFGAAVVGAGDTNGDGFGDLLAASPRVDMYTGRVYVFRGGPAGVAATAAQNLFDLSAGAGALFGGTLGAGRDVDNDGLGDCVISAERGTMFTGQVTVLRGGAEGLARPTVFTGPSGPGARFGIGLAWRLMVCRAPRT